MFSPFFFLLHSTSANLLPLLSKYICNHRTISCDWHCYHHGPSQHLLFPKIISISPNSLKQLGIYSFTTYSRPHTCSCSLTSAACWPTSLGLFVPKGFFSCFAVNVNPSWPSLTSERFGHRVAATTPLSTRSYSCLEKGVSLLS